MALEVRIFQAKSKGHRESEQDDHQSSNNCNRLCLSVQPLLLTTLEVSAIYESHKFR